MAERPLPAYDGDEPYVFVSYSHEDDELVHPQIRWLQELGFNVWWDEGISPGASWRTELTDALGECSLIIYFITPNSAAAEQCTREINYGLDQFRRPVLAVHLLETELPHALGLVLSDRQAILQYILEPADYERKLVTAVATYLAQPIPTAPTVSPARRFSPTRVKVLSAALVGSLVTAVAIAVVIAARQWPGATPLATQEARSVRFEIVLPEGVDLPTDYATYLNIAPSGDLIYFIGEHADLSRQVYMRRLDEVRTIGLPETYSAGGGDGLVGVFPSPDGGSVMLAYRDGWLKMASLSGGPPAPYVQFESMAGRTQRVDWGLQDQIVLRSSRSTIAWQSTKTPGLQSLASDEGYLLTHPRIGPKGEWLWFSRISNQQHSAIMVKSLKSGETKVVADGIDPRLTSTGHLLFSRDQSIWAAEISSSGDAIVREPVRVLRDVKMAPLGSALYAIAHNGTLVYQLPSSPMLQLVWVSRTGSEEAIALEPQARFTHFRISPDQKHIAFTRGDEMDLWSYSISDGLHSRRVAANGAYMFSPLWTLDNQRVVFGRETSLFHARNLYITDFREPGSLKLLLENGPFLDARSWTPDGETLIYSKCVSNVLTGCDVEAAHPIIDKEPHTVLATGFNERHPELSPDGRYLAYTSDEFGQDRIVIRPFPEVTTAYWQIPVDGCSQPRWSAAGDELFALCSGNLTATPVTAESTFNLGAPKTLFSTTPYQDNIFVAYDVSADGRRFLMLKGVKSAAKVVVVLNWLDEVRRLVEAAN